MMGKIGLAIGIPILSLALLSIFVIDFETFEIKAFQGGDIKLVQSNTAIEDEITAKVIKGEEPQGRVINIEIHDGVGSSDSLGN